MVPLNPEAATASSRKCSRSTPLTAMMSASASAPACAGVISCSWAEALGASRQVREIVFFAFSAGAPRWLVVPSASVLSRARPPEASAPIWVM